MKCSNSQLSIVQHSIIWAVLIVVISYLLKDNLIEPNVKNTIFILMTGAWFSSHSILSKAKGLKIISNCEAKLFRRFFTKENSKSEK